jgi:Asp-tRNA(Asn)/Glu-tRNA(Gln) amidotransferase B subunit
MNTNIRVTISKEDRFNVQDLVYEIFANPQSAYDLCELYGTEAFTLEAFADFENLPEEAKDRLIEDFAISKSEADAELTNSQAEKFDFFSQYFEGED